MKIMVAVKQVAALDEDFEFRDDELDVDEDFLLYDLNEWDDFSLEEAMKNENAKRNLADTAEQVYRLWR